MTDLHTHILPGMDDGAPDAATSIAMLQMEYEQGVDAVALTPHFYPERESIEGFLERRDKAFTQLRRQIAQLPEQTQCALPELLLGAEVAWVPGIAEMPHLSALCYKDSNLLLLELPFGKWGNSLFRELNDLMNRRALTPVIAHIDRYMGLQNRKELTKLLEIGLPVQISASALNVPFLRRRAMKVLQSGQATLLISDCHDLKMRKPNLETAYSLVQKKLGKDFAETIQDSTDMLIEIAT